MTGSLEHVQGDRWKVRLYAGLTQDKKQRQVTKSFRAPNLQAARRAMPKIVAALQDAIDEEAKRVDTIAALADEWLQQVRNTKRSPSTVAGYERLARTIVTRFGNVKVADLTARDIDRWYADLAKGGMTPATIQHHHAVLRAMLRQAEKWDMVGRVVTRNASPPSVERVELSLPTSAAMLAVLDQARGDFAVAVALLAATGLRRGELVALRWDDLVGDRLTVRRALLKLAGQPLHEKLPKGKKPRVVDLDPETVTMLGRHRASVEARMAGVGAGMTPWMFPALRRDPSGRTPHAPGWLTGEWAKLCTRAGVKVRLHDIRHWHVSTLIARGASMAEVQKRAGHAQMSTTMNLYGHLIPGQRSEAPALIRGEIERARHAKPAGAVQEPVKVG